MSTAELLEPSLAPAPPESPAAPEEFGIGPWTWQQVALGLGFLVAWRAFMMLAHDYIAEWPPLLHVVFGAMVPQLWMIFYPLTVARLTGNDKPFRIPGPVTTLREGAIGVVCGFMTLGLLYALAMLYQWLTSEPLGTAVDAAANGTAEVVILACLAFTVTPFAEELFFRGFIYGALRERYGIVTGLLAQAAIFAVLHDMAPLKLVVIFVLGLVLGCLYEVRRTMATSIAAHATLNLMWSLAVFAMMLIFAHAPWLGVQGEAVEAGVAVKKVQPDSPAAEAGLREGDIVLSLGGEKIFSQEQMAKLVRSKKAGDKVAVELLREGKPLTLEAELAKRPKAD